jgi:hypothetical protein
VEGWLQEDVDPKHRLELKEHVDSGVYVKDLTPSRSHSVLGVPEKARGWILAGYIALRWHARTTPR